MGLEKLNEFKKSAGLTNQAIAEMANLPISTVDKIMSGRTTDPKLETIKAITHVMGHTVDDLFEDELEKDKQKNPPPQKEWRTEDMDEETLKAYNLLWKLVVELGWVQANQDITPKQGEALISFFKLLQIVFKPNSD